MAGLAIKVAKHHHRDQTVDPDSYDRTVSVADEAQIRTMLSEHIPAADGRMLAAKTCLYTMTPDGDFIIDRLPGSESIIVASPCSGHGFKFAPVIGEILADLGPARQNAARHFPFPAGAIWIMACCATGLFGMDKVAHPGASRLKEASPQCGARETQVLPCISLRARPYLMQPAHPGSVERALRAR